MRKGNQREEFLVKGRKVYMAIDVYKDSCHVTAQAAEEEVFNGRLPSDYPVLRWPLFLTVRKKGGSDPLK